MLNSFESQTLTPAANEGVPDTARNKVIVVLELVTKHFMKSGGAEVEQKVGLFLNLSSHTAMHFSLIASEN